MTEEEAKIKLAEIAARINAHLKRFASDPQINAPLNGKRGGLTPYYYPGAHVAGSRVAVWYVTYQSHAKLKKADALKYLAWLDAGNVGSHYEMDK